MILFRRIGVSLLLFAGLAFMSLTFSAMALGQGKKDAGAKKDAVKSAPGRVNWNETKVAFDMRGKTWDSTIKWFCQQVQMPLAGKYPPPTGTVSFYNVLDEKGKPREYNLTEVFDLLNEMLMSEYSHILLRRETTLMIFPADVQIPPHLIPRIQVADLADRGKTEIVEVTLSLKASLNAEEFAPKAKRLLGDFSSVTPIDDTNQLIIRADVASIRRHLATLTGKDVTGKISVGGPEEEPSAHNLAHKCIYLRATAAEALLRKSMGNLIQVIETKGPAVAANPMDKGETPGGPGGFSKGGTPGGGGAATSRRVRTTVISSDSATNTVFVTGPADKVELARLVLSKADVARAPGEKGILVGPPFFKIHEVPLGNADVMAKMIGDIFKDDSIRINVNPPSRLLVYADPQTHLEINLLLNAEPPAVQKTELIGLARLDAVKFADNLKEMFPDSKNSSPYIGADHESNSIRLRGTPEQVKSVRDVIMQLDGGSSSAGAGVRMITLEKGSGATVAEALQLLFPRIRDNPLDVNLPGGGFEEKKGQKGQKDEKKSGAPKAEPVPAPKGSTQKPPMRLTPDMVRQAMYDDAPVKTSPVISLAQDKLAELQPNKEPDKKKPRVTITAFGNRILITSEDPEALDLLQQMVRILVNTEAGPGDFEVLRLQYANATEVAKILDEAFNGPKGGQGGGGGGRAPGGGGIGNLLGGGGIAGLVLGGGGQGGSARIENIRVVADPGTNSLLVRAKPIDLMTIRRLLKTSLDRRDTESEAAFKDFVIGPLKNANAIAVAEILERIYHDSLNAKAQTTSAANVPGGGFFFNSQRTSDPTNSSASLLSVAVDNTTNSVVVRCPTTLYKEIENLVKELDRTAGDNKQIVKIIPVSDIDPYVLQAAIDAISGKQVTSAQQRGNFGSTMTPGSFAPGGFGTPGRGTFGGGTPGFGGGGNPFGGGGFGTPGGGFGAPGGGFGAPGGGFGAPGGGGFRGGAPGGGGGPPGGGGAAPGGGGRPGGGGGGRGPGGAQSRGPDFFEQRVMDDPSVRNVLYDPAEQPDAPVMVRDVNVPVIPVYTANPFYFASYLQPDEKLQPEIVPEKVQPPKAAEGTVVAPRLPVLIEPVPSVGGIILKGDPKDVEAVLRIIDALRQQALGAKVEIQLVPVRLGDPTQITGELNKLLARVQLDPSFTRIGASGPGGGAPGAGGGAGAAQPVPLSVVLLPQPRLSAILVAAPAARMRDVIGYIQQFDTLVSDANSLVIIPLKHAPASQVATALNVFYATRYSPPEAAGGYNQIRISADVRTNAIWVQAAPADLIGIKGLIEHIDNPRANLAANDMRVVQLKNAVAVDLAQLLQASIANGILTTTPQAAGPGVTAPGAPGGGGVAPAGGPAGAAGGGLMTKDQNVRFISGRDKNGKPVESSVLEDIRVNPDPRTNSLVVSAPRDTMPLLLALIAELDVQPGARMEINIFTLKKSDATLMAQTLQQLFLGVSGGIGATPAGGGGGAPGGGAGGLGTVGTAGATRPIQITIANTVPEGPPIIDLRLTVDQRTNSLIVAGSRNDLLVVGSIIGRIEDAKVPDRCNQVVRLRNAQAVDVVNALTTYITNVNTIPKTYGQGTNSLEPNREIVVVAEPITNSILINATPEFFDIMVKMIAQLDTTPPQVVVSVLIAQVTLNGNEEFGCEIGLQSPITFARQVLPGAGTLAYTTTAPTGAGTGLSGVSSTGTTTVAQNGTNFNLIGNPNNSLGSGIQNPGMVGYQGLTNLGVGRSSATSGIGGFVFSAQGSMVNVLLRALKTQERLTVLSRPNVQTLDKQAAVVSVGQQIPLNNGSNATATGVVSTAIVRQTVGVTLQVTPTITPDGRVMMRVIPEVTGVASTAFPLGDGTFSTSLSIQHLETTVNAEDGETVLLGGLISKQSDKNENKVPWLGDLPGVGSLFRFRTETTTQTELIIIMTPHIVRNRQEGERVLAEEARRIDWNLKDVMRAHGPSNCSTFMPPVEPPAPSPIQPYRIIPGPRQPSRIMPGGEPLNGFQGMPTMQPNGFQGPTPQMMPPGAQSNQIVPPASQANTNQGALGMLTVQPPPAPPSSNMVGATRIPTMPPVDMPMKAPAVLPASPGAVPPARMPLMAPPDLQLQAPPAFTPNAPFMMPAQTNYYDKK